MKKISLLLLPICLAGLVIFSSPLSVRADAACDPTDCLDGTDAPFPVYGCRLYESPDKSVSHCEEYLDYTAMGTCVEYTSTVDGFDYCQINGETGINQGGCITWEPVLGDCYSKLASSTYNSHVGCCPGYLGEDPDDASCELQSDILTTCASTGFSSATRGLLAQVFNISDGNWFGTPLNRPPNTELPVTLGIEYPKGLIGPDECWGLWGGVRWEGYVNFKQAGIYSFKSDLVHADTSNPYGLAVYLDEDLDPWYSLSATEDWCDGDGDGEEDELCSSSQESITVTTPGWKKFRLDLWGGGWWSNVAFETKIGYNIGLVGSSGWQKITTTVNPWFEIAPCPQVVTVPPVCESWTSINISETGLPGDFCSQTDFSVPTEGCKTPSTSVTLFNNSPTATEMIHRNVDPAAWCSAEVFDPADPGWVPYTPTRAWTLPGGAGAKKVCGNFRNSAGPALAPCGALIYHTAPVCGSYSCSADGTQVTLNYSYTPVPDSQARTIIRLDKDPYTDWANAAAGDQWICAPANTSSYTATISPNTWYWWRNVQATDNTCAPRWEYADCGQYLNCLGPIPTLGPTPTPSLTPTPEPTPVLVRIQGLKVDEKNCWGELNPVLNAIPACLNPWDPAFWSCLTGNPYWLYYYIYSEPVEGAVDRTVTMGGTPAGFTLMGSTKCYNQTGCHDVPAAIPTPGISTGISDWSALYDDPNLTDGDKFVDLWWHYCPAQSAPTAVSAVTDCDTAIVSWTEPAVIPATGYYRLLVDGVVQPGSYPVGTTTASISLSGGGHTIAVQAYNCCQNYGQSTNVNLSIPLIPTPPDPNGFTDYGTSVEVSFIDQAVDEDWFEVFRDGTPYTTVSPGKPAIGEEINFTGLDCSVSHTYTATACDAQNPLTCQCSDQSDINLAQCVASTSWFQGGGGGGVAAGRSINMNVPATSPEYWLIPSLTASVGVAYFPGDSTAIASFAPFVSDRGWIAAIGNGWSDMIAKPENQYLAIKENVVDRIPDLTPESDSTYTQTQLRDKITVAPAADWLASPIKVLEITGSLVLSGDIDLEGRRVIIFVDNNVTVNGEIAVDLGSGGFLAIISGGDITIDGNVGIVVPLNSPYQVDIKLTSINPNLTGIFYAGNDFKTSTTPDPVTGRDKQLKIIGTVVAINNVSLDRQSPGLWPAEYVEFNPYLTKTLRDIGLRRIIRQQLVAP